MLQIDHVYNFLYQELFKDFDFYCLQGGVIKNNNVDITDICVFTTDLTSTKKIFFYDQEPFVDNLAFPYMELFTWESRYSIDQLLYMIADNKLPYGIATPTQQQLEILLAGPLECVYKQGVLVTSEYSPMVNNCVKKYNLKSLYYFYHGFAALDWYRGHYALNYSKPVIKQYAWNFISYNRITHNDRSYRIYWVSKLKEFGLLAQGQVSFDVSDNEQESWRSELANPNTKLSTHAQQHIQQHLVDVCRLTVDQDQLPGSASADIPSCVNDSFWHIVTETVFYYDKLHLTEKIFKPIVSKQPFMLLAAPGNLAYLKSYGFKTFDSVIDESYDSIQDHDQRTHAVVEQLHWYCNLSAQEKNSVIERIAPIVEHNFHHFYGKFRHIITQELLTNTKAVFKQVGYDDQAIAYDDIYHVLTT